MGRLKNKKNPLKAAKSSAAGVASSSKPTAPSIESLIEKAQTLIVQCDYELARKFLVRILERDSIHAEAREMLGFVQVETGELDSAREIFTSLIPPSKSAPSRPPASAYLYLAQLTEDDPRTALNLYQQAFDLLLALIKERSSVTTEEQIAEYRKMAVRALVSMVEIWMTDLCFEEDAESNCDSLLTLALEIDPNNVEALQSLASVRMSQQRPDEARVLAEKSWSLWKDLDADDPLLPPFSVRLSLTRLLLELSLYHQALTILQDIIASDDQDVEAWYLEGWCFFLMGDAVKEGATIEGVDELTWEDLKRDARDCLEMCKGLHKAQEHPDEQLLSHAIELINELENAGIKPSPEGQDEAQNGDGGSETEWEDEDDADVEMS
ncbi:hypothetical protein FRC02_012493 [Tulasnella sp. 418]|nr:hypothetical protein FRC02_012493 [Tulasnella sp. 418]